MAVSVDIKKLLEAGAHFGHTTSRWHPKMAPFIHSKRAGNHIIDLTKTVEAVEEALPIISKAVADGKQVLLVGTKRQAKDLVLKAAEDTGMPYVVNRWVGGMLTNTTTMNGRIKYLQDLENKMASGELANRYNKLEVQRFQEEIDQMNHLYGGIKNLQGRPGLVYVTDVVTDHLAVKEAKRLGVPVVGVVDSNADPTTVDYPIPANDDALKAIQQLLDYVVAAIQEGKSKVKTAKAE
jgi:small subunit ribosomal protein S2